MSTKKTENKKPKDPFERVRKVGQRDEMHERRLTDVEMDDLHAQYLALGNQREELEEKKAEVLANYNAQFKAIDLQSDTTRKLLNSRRRSDTITVEEWLNASNEIVRIRADTGEQLGDPRKARADELQEKLFPDPAQDGEPEAEHDADEATPPDISGESPMFGDGDGLG